MGPAAWAGGFAVRASGRTDGKPPASSKGALAPLSAASPTSGPPCAWPLWGEVKGALGLRRRRSKGAQPLASSAKSKAPRLYPWLRPSEAKSKGCSASPQRGEAKRHPVRELSPESIRRLVSQKASPLAKPLARGNKHDREKAKLNLNGFQFGR